RQQAARRQRAIRHNNPAAVRHRSADWWWPYVAANVLFVAALLSKTVTCSLPAILLILAWWQRGTLDRRTLLRLLPFFALGLLLAAVTVWMEHYYVGAKGEQFALS